MMNKIRRCTLLLTDFATLPGNVVHPALRAEDSLTPEPEQYPPELTGSITGQVVLDMTLADPFILHC